MFLAKEEPWRIKDDPVKKAKILSYSVHNLLAVAPHFSAVIPTFHKDLSKFCSSVFRPVGSIEQSLNENQHILSSEKFDDLLAQPQNFRRNKATLKNV